VELVVTNPVVSVVVELDGERMAELTGPPWRFEHDFGTELLPHELVAVGLDAEGKEVDRARQWVNLSRHRADATLVLLRDAEGRPEAVSVLWNNAQREGPEKISVLVDGEPADASDPERIGLPPLDPRTVHVVTAKLTLPDGDEIQVAQAFGPGVDEQDVGAQLTAFPVRVTGKKKDEPTVERLEGVFRHGDEPLRVMAVEKGVAQIYVVLDPQVGGRVGVPSVTGRALAHQGMGADSRLRIVSPYGVPAAGGGEIEALLFPRGMVWDGERSDITDLLSRFVPRPPDGAGVAFAPVDAVAVSGSLACDGGYRRAVVALVGPSAGDGSRSTIPVVRRYLDVLGVPLFVWSPDPKSVPMEWGPATPVRSDSQLRAALAALRKNLDRQRIVWLAGEHLPTAIEIAGDSGLVSALSSETARKGRNEGK
jgi:hypothetical protein